MVDATPAKPLPSPEPEVLGESKVPGGPTGMEVDEISHPVADDETEKCFVCIIYTSRCFDVTDMSSSLP